MDFFAILGGYGDTGVKSEISRSEEERDRRPWWLVDYSYSNLNSKTLPISAMSAIIYGEALEHLIREIVIANPPLGPVHVLKANISDVFYHIVLRPTYAPKLGLVFPSEGED